MKILETVLDINLLLFGGLLFRAEMVMFFLLKIVSFKVKIVTMMTMMTMMSMMTMMTTTMTMMTLLIGTDKALCDQYRQLPFFTDFSP